MLLFRVLYNYCQRFADLRWAGLSAQMFIRGRKFSATTKLSAEHETPPSANVLLAAGLFVKLILLKDFNVRQFAF